MSTKENPTPAPTPNQEADETNNTNPKTPGEIDQDRECQEILEIKDYYEVLGIPKTSDEKEIKRAYKKVNFFISKRIFNLFKSTACYKISSW